MDLQPLETSAISPNGFGAEHDEPPEALRGPLPEAVASPLLFVGLPGNCPDLAALANVRLAKAISAPSAANYVRKTATLDIVWVSGADAVESETLADICAAAEVQGCNLVFEAELAALDRIVAVIPASLNAQFLVDADPTDRLVALATARRARDGVFHDVARDDAMERIDRLQEEVARISRLLGDLAGHRGGLPGTPTGYISRTEDLSDYPEQVRTPSRDFTAMPRSFVPEERTLDRQRAKAVRRMLRQRRMREQYFPPTCSPIRRGTCCSTLCRAARTPAGLGVEPVHRRCGSRDDCAALDQDDDRRRPVRARGRSARWPPYLHRPSRRRL